ncbi:MAG: DoxX family protein [Gammaproteobacteria bacterium]|nr:DoxX family protein [Gammaproteobacteria bacterium]
MDKLIQLYGNINSILDRARPAEFLAPLLIRLYLAPVMWMAGIQKFNNFDSTAEWFGNAEWGLGLPAPALMAFLATATELVGAVFLFFGFAVRIISVPLMITMLVAAFTVHIQNGWLAIATGSGVFATERTTGAVDRLDKAKEILKQHGNYDWLTENGSFVVLNNGIEFAVTYFIMLLVLFYLGSGKASIEHLLCKNLCK